MKKFIVNNPVLSFILSTVIGIIAGVIGSYYKPIIGPAVWFLITFTISQYIFSVLNKELNNISYSDPPKEDEHMFPKKKLPSSSINFMKCKTRIKH